MSIAWQKSTGLRAGKNVHCVAEKYRAEGREECPLCGRKVQG